MTCMSTSISPLKTASAHSSRAKPAHLFLGEKSLLLKLRPEYECKWSHLWTHISLNLHLTIKKYLGSKNPCHVSSIAIVRFIEALLCCLHVMRFQRGSARSLLKLGQRCWDLKFRRQVAIPKHRGPSPNPDGRADARLPTESKMTGSEDVRLIQQLKVIKGRC